jgi:hypothetical protein
MKQIVISTNILLICNALPLADLIVYLGST